MKKIMNYVNYMIYGMGIGFPVTLGCMALYGGMNPVVKACMVWAAASALYGLLSALVFRQKRPFPVELGLHGLGCFLITLGAGAICGYLDSVSQAAFMLVTFLVVYTAVCLFVFLGQKQEAKRANEALNQK